MSLGRIGPLNRTQLWARSPWPIGHGAASIHRTPYVADLSGVTGAEARGRWFGRYGSVWFGMAGCSAASVAPTVRELRTAARERMSRGQDAGATVDACGKASGPTATWTTCYAGPVARRAHEADAVDARAAIAAHPVCMAWGDGECVWGRPARQGSQSLYRSLS